MKKRLLTLTLAAVMAVGASFTAFAEKKVVEEVNPATQNIYAAWGDFESEKSLGVVTVPNAAAARVKGGANGTDYALKLTGQEENRYCTFNFPFPAVKGESYDISFYVKTDTPESIARLSLVFSYTDGGWSYGTGAPVTGGWTKYTATWYCDGKNTRGEDVSGDGKLEIRFGSPVPRHSIF